jgi:PKD domain.
MRFFFSTFLLSIFFINAQAQQRLNVLYLGNSYTSVNNLPQMTSLLSLGTHRTINYESNTPGGSTLEQHSRNNTSLALIRKGNWDYVVLQEQSQMPSIDYYRYQSMYPAVEQLTDSIKKYSPCATVVMYLTWGRLLGGQQCEDYGNGTYCSADFRDFDHMQDTLTSSYNQIAYQTNSYIAPAGEAWREVLNNTDITLHSADGSHPNTAGTYLTACVLHSVFWHESPIGVTNCTTLDNETIMKLQRYAHQVVMETPKTWNLHVDDVFADFTSVVEEATVNFINLSESLSPCEYLWDFGDGCYSTEENPEHTYQHNDDYLVKLKTESCLKNDSCIQIVKLDPLSEKETRQIKAPIIYPNPASFEIQIQYDGKYTAEIFNMFGTSIFKEENLNGTRFINLDSVPKGSYLLKIQTKDNDRDFVKKLIKI